MKRMKYNIKHEMPEPSTSRYSDLEEHDLAYYIQDRVELMHQVFSVLKHKDLKAMAPEGVRRLSINDLQELCLEELLGISSKRLCAILDGAEPPSDTESSSPSPERLETISLDSISSDDEILSQGSSKKRKKHKHHKRRGSKSKNKNKKSKERSSEEVDGEETRASRAGLTVLELLELQARARAIRAQLQNEQANKPTSETVALENSRHSSDNEVEIKEEQAEVVEISSEDEKPKIENLFPVPEKQKSTSNELHIEGNAQTVTERRNNLIITVPQSKQSRKIKLNRNKNVPVSKPEGNTSKDVVTEKKSMEQPSSVVSPEKNEEFSMKVKNDEIQNKNDVRPKAKSRKKQKKKEKKRPKTDNEGSDRDEICLQLSDSEKMDLLEDLDRKNFDNISSSGSEDTGTSSSSNSDSEEDSVSSGSKGTSDIIQNKNSIPKKDKVLSSLKPSNDNVTKELSEAVKISELDSNEQTAGTQSSSQIELHMEQSCNVETVNGTENNCLEPPESRIPENSGKIIEITRISDIPLIHDKEMNKVEIKETGRNEIKETNKDESQKENKDKNKEINRNERKETNKVVFNETSKGENEKTDKDVNKGTNKDDSNETNKYKNNEPNKGHLETNKNENEKSNKDENNETDRNESLSIETGSANIIEIDSELSNDLVTKNNKQNKSEQHKIHNDFTPLVNAATEKSVSEKEIFFVQNYDTNEKTAQSECEKRNLHKHAPETADHVKGIDKELSEGEVSDRQSSEVEAFDVQPEVVCISDEDAGNKGFKKKKNKKKDKKSKKEKKAKKSKSDFREDGDQNFYKDIKLQSIDNNNCFDKQIQDSGLSSPITLVGDDDVYEILELSDDSSCFEVEGVSVLSKEPTTEEIEALSAKIDEIDREDVVTDEQIRKHEEVQTQNDENEEGTGHLQNISWKDRYLGSRKVKRVLTTSNIFNALRKKNKELKKKIKQSKKKEAETETQKSEEILNLRTLEEGSIEQYNTLQGSMKYVKPIADLESKTDDTGNENVTDIIMNREITVSKEMKKDAKQLLKMYKKLLKYNDMNRQKDMNRKKKKEKKSKNKE